MSHAVLAAETVLCLAIIRFIRFTNIDWNAYMQQVDIVLKGEHDYTLIQGDTGPLVYPAGHVWAYTTLHHLTNGGKDIGAAQYVFLALYVLTIAIVFRLYRYNAKIPPYAYALLVLSKRLHSIYLLRCFNDGIAMLPLYLSIYAMSLDRWQLAALFYSLALSVKMNILLFAPALGFLFLLRHGIVGAVFYGVQALALQLVLAQTFLLHDWKAYLSRAFEFSRTFLFEWTVNWRFLGEATFTSPALSAGLLAGHVTVLVYASMRWSLPYGGITSLLSKICNQPGLPVARRLSAAYVINVMFSCNLIGMLFARSLHYQFYAWEAHQLIYLAWLAPLPTAFRLLILFAIEVGWETFPSTGFSSLALLAGHAVLVVAVLRKEVWR